MTTIAPEVSPKVPNLKAFEDSDLPEAPVGTVWQIVEVGKVDFAILAASDLEGVAYLTKGNEAKAAQLFNRALRIDAPAKLDARERLDTARKNGTLETVVQKLQEEFVDFDVTSITVRQPRTPTTVTAPEKESYSKAEVQAMLDAAKIRFITK